MNGKELLYAKLKGEPTSRIPWVPFAGIHAGKLISTSARDLYQNSDLLLKALLKVNELYKPDGQPVMFDLQIEAEVMGCELRWAEKNPPMVVTHPWSEITEIPHVNFSESMGRLPLLMETTQKLKSVVGEHTAILGLFTGPFTLASHLRGTNIFIDMINKKELALQIIEACSEISLKMVDFYAKAGVDVIALVDPVVSQISPRMFKEMLAGTFSKIFNHIKLKKRFSSFFVCGNATKIIPPICETHPDSIFVDENVDMVLAQKSTDPRGIILGGNIPLTSVMLYGSQQDNMKFTVDLINKLNHEHLIIAPGCDMPYDIPIENVIGVVEAVRRPEEIAKTLENYFKPPLNIEVILPDYTTLTRPLIELFTLDSSQCAACQYMLAVAQLALEKFPNQVDLVEYKWTELENIVRTQKMGVEHLPCIYIDGQLKWSSIIPSEDEYFAKIEEILQKYN